jgi:hypothetical protein
MAASAELDPDGRTVAVGPGSLDQDPAKVRVASLGDRPPALAWSARVLRRNPAGESHE